MRKISELFKDFVSLLNWHWYSLTYSKSFDMINTGKIVDMGDGFVLMDNKGYHITAYKRRRDAVRGASRRGIAV